MPKLIQLGSPYLPGESPYSIFQNRMEAVNTLAEGIGKIMKNKYESGLIQAIVQDIGNPSSPEQISKRSSEIQNGEEAINQQEILDFAIPAIDVMAQSIQGIPEVKEITRRKGAVEQLIGGGTVGEAPEVVTEEAEQPFVLPSGSIESILAYIEGMQGAVDLTKAKEAIMKRPKYLPPSGLETSIANYLLNKPSPQEQFITNVKSAKTLQDILYPEIAEQRELETYGKQLQMQQEKELGTYATKLAMEEALKTPPLTGEQVEERMKALTPPGYEVTNAQVYGDEVHVNLKPAEGEKLSVDETIKQFQQYGVKPHSITLDENGNISSMTLTEPTSVLATGGGGRVLPQSMQNELFALTDPAEYDNKINLAASMGYDVSNFYSPATKMNILLENQKSYQEAMDICLENIEAGILSDKETNYVERYQEFVKQYNKFAQAINQLAGGKVIEEYTTSEMQTVIPTRGYDIRPGKWRGQVDTEKLAGRLVAETNDLEQILSWVTTHQELTEEEKEETIQEVIKRLK